MSNLLLLRIILRVHASSDKFGVIDNSIVVRIDDEHCLFDVIYTQLNLRNSLNTLKQFLMSQLSISILVELSESSSEFCDLRLRDSRCNVGKCGLSKLGVVHVLLHVGHHLWVQFDQVVFSVSLRLNPRVVKCFLSCQTHVS